MKPTPMVQLIAVILDADVDSVTRKLLEAGVIDFIDRKEVAGELELKTIGDSESTREIARLRSKIETMLAEAAVDTSSIELDLSRMDSLDLENVASQIDRVSRRIEEFRTTESDAELELGNLHEIKRQISLFGTMDSAINSEPRFSFLSFHTGSVEEMKAPNLRDSIDPFSAVLVENGASDGRLHFVLIAMKRDDRTMEEILHGHGWSDMPAITPVDRGREVESSIEERISRTTQRIDEAREGRIAELDSYREELVEFWKQLRIRELYGEVQSNFSRTKRTVVFSGWMPEHRREEIEGRIHDACGNRHYVEWRHPSPLEIKSIPVEMRNPKFLAPFELLVRNFALPAYGSVDPTPLVALTYLVMFGLMFGDAGHGLVLILAGIIGRLIGRPRDSVRKLLTLLIWCGASAVITGVLFGSYFGMQWFPPIWFDFHGIVSGHSGGRLVSNIYDVLAITVYFGVSVIGLGLLINWINLIGRRNWFELIFDKAGVLGGVVYGAGFAGGVSFVRSGYTTLPDARLLLLGIAFPLVLFAFKPPIVYLRKRRRGRAGRLHLLSFVDFAMEWIVEMLELFSGYLANTLSFMRVAGLGIAHEALLIAFFEIAYSVGGGTIKPLSLLVLLAGQILTILLEGLSAGIQSLRLNYYEFFSKYFTAAKRGYSPVSLQTKARKESA